MLSNTLTEASMDAQTLDMATSLNKIPTPPTLPSSVYLQTKWTLSILNNAYFWKWYMMGWYQQASVWRISGVLRQQSMLE